MSRERSPTPLAPGKAELSTRNGEFSAHLSGGGAEGVISTDGEEKSLTSPTGVKFQLVLPATGKSQPSILAEEGKQPIDLAFPTATYGQSNKEQGKKPTKVTPKGGVKAGVEDHSSDPDTTMLLAGGGAAAAAAALGFAALRRRRTSGGNA